MEKIVFGAYWNSSLSFPVNLSEDYSHGKYSMFSAQRYSDRLIAIVSKFLLSN
jgi:hypothetical protein